MKKFSLIYSFLFIVFDLYSQKCDTNLFPNGKQYFDTYREVANLPSQWKHYNVHDPTVYKDGEYYYMYSTDASWGNVHNTGALKRRSKDLVNWEFLGTAFNGTPLSAQNFFKQYNPNYTDQGIWAPFLFKFKNKYYLYYSAPGGLENKNLAYIGYAVSNSANGPWEDKGMIVTSYLDTINAIDPSVIYDSVTGRLWMSYGSWYNGIYMIELDTATGGNKIPGYKGFRIANRETPAKGLEGSELTYRNGWYYLFVSYDPLGDIYNVRVGRSKSPTGPYLDFNGNPMTNKADNIPMILAPYKFNYHPGWQGTGHCGVYNDNGTYYMFHQGRPSIEPTMMVLHVRKIYWVDDWPVVSPEMYAGVPECEIPVDSIVGEWENLPLIYKTSSTNFHSTSQKLIISADGTFNNNTSNTWTFNNDTLILNWNNGVYKYKLIVHWGWDWENSCRTLLYTGLSSTGIAVWGKKINQQAIDRFNKIVPGAAYLIRSQCSNMVIEVPNGNEYQGVQIKQNVDKNKTYQLWRVLDAGNGYYRFKNVASTAGRVIEVSGGSPNNGALIVLGNNDGSDKSKFRILSNNNNGYFRILTKVSGDSRAIDLISFSTDIGAGLIQWDYWGAVNQAWRFMRIDSLGIDTTGSYNNVEISLSENNIRIFPNPSNGRVNIILPSNEKSFIYIYNIDGKVIYNNSFNEKELIIDLKNISRGLYYIKLIYQNNILSEKLIIK